MPTSLRKALIAAVAGAAVIGGSLAYGVSAHAEEAAAEPASLVEDFSYPGAAKIEADKKIKLIKGDGRIMLAECGSANDLIQVESYNNLSEPVYCFKVLGSTGLLALEIPNVYFIWAGDEKVTATVTVGGVQKEPVVVAANDGEPVGAEDPKNHAVLLELRV
ncbi:hypothetical protein BC793_13256 [Actinoplanes xinjiangensis]|uniref:Secreted protein n=2 Tax=Actinoplanes xinjiangensis TaxID=512350 RepID=A0A316ENY2_9ACTN|nr:hypothetical protein BC793_13256 [Actinoplanes xinjiangensis]GIF43919.1 hypothetical protein Axi01nite_82300 [Actinoplanes xinjiangensis]